MHADGSCRGVVQLNATGSDPDGDTLTYTWDDGSAGPSPVVALPLGDHVLTVTVSDGNGGRAQDSVLISVVDATPPSVDGSALGSTALWPPNHSMHVVGNVGSVLVTDNCDPATEVTWALFSDERDNAQGDGDTTCDASIDGLGDLHVRAERQGSGDGRVVTLVAVAEDASGNIVDWSGVVATVPPSAAARAVDSGTWYEPTCP